MFPNQDEIPKGGYGNLIALPLQGKAVKEGHSVFVDEDFKPFDDQWRFLSSIKKIDEKSIRSAIREIENQLLDFVEKDESQISDNNIQNNINENHDIFEDLLNIEPNTSNDNINQINDEFLNESKEIQEEIEEDIEKPNINIDVDSIIVDNNITDDEFFDDFFGDDE